MFEIERMKTGGVQPDMRSVPDVAKVLMSNVSFAKDPSEKLYYYKNGVYKEGGEKAVAYLYQQLCAEINIDRWNDTFPKKITMFILARSPQIMDRPDMYMINFQNGIYHIGDNTFEPHEETDHSGYRTTVQIPHNYDASVQGGFWKKFCADVFPEDPQLLMDIVGLCLIPFTGLQKCIVLLGTGSNGKGTYLKGLQNVIGHNNYANLDMKRLAGYNDRFSMSNLVGKLVNVFGDLPPTKIENTALFKALTGEDTVTVEYKGKQPFSYKPFSRLIFSCNEIMDTDDTTIGYKRRFFCIPFDREFELDPSKGLEIDEKLADETEIAALLNNVLPRLTDLIENGLAYNEAATSKVENYVPVPQWFRSWFNDHIEVSFGARVKSEELFRYYAEYVCSYKPSHMFIRKESLLAFLKTVAPATEINKISWVGGKTSRCVEGIRFKKPNENYNNFVGSAREVN